MTENYERSAHRLRVVALVMFILAAGFAVAGIVLWIMTGLLTNLITLSSAALIAVSGVSVHGTARRYDDLARRYRF